MSVTLTRTVLDDLERFKDVLKMGKKEYAALKLYLVLNENTDKDSVLTFDEFKEYSAESHGFLKQWINSFPNENIATKQRLDMSGLLDFFNQLSDRLTYKNELTFGSQEIKTGESSEKYHAINGGDWRVEVRKWSEKDSVQLTIKSINDDGTTSGVHSIDIQDSGELFSIGAYLKAVSGLKKKES